MATDDVASHVDQAFADGPLVDEVMKFAAREAAHRHRQVGQPMVVFRDGRIAHVLVHGQLPELLLTENELAVERTANDFAQWFENRLSTINNSPNAKQSALLHQGLFKRFYEEVYPFALFVRHLYSGRDDVICSLNSPEGHNRDYDAVIRDHSTSPPSQTYIQLTTTTFDRDESRRMQYFLEHGWVPVWGEIDDSGAVEMEFIAHEELLERTFAAIQQVVQRKSSFTHGANYALVVSFNDFMWFGTPDDLAALTSFVNERLRSWRLNVGTLYIVGISDRIFLSFPVPATDRSSISSY